MDILTNLRGVKRKIVECRIIYWLDMLTTCRNLGQFFYKQCSYIMFFTFNILEKIVFGKQVLYNAVRVRFYKYSTSTVV